MCFFLKARALTLKMVLLGITLVVVGCANLGINEVQADRTTPEGVIYATYRAAEKGDLAEVMSLVDLKNEFKPLPAEYYDNALELLEPKVRPQLDQIKAILVEKKGLTKVNVKSKRTLESGAIELTFDMIMGNGEVMTNEVAKLKLVDGRYYLWLN